MTTAQVSSQDYNSLVFDGKNAQQAEVAEIIKSKGFVPEALVENEVSWFYG
jgi:glutamate dehydrogenase